jgi:hypothetical protein
MSVDVRRRVTARRTWSAALAAGVLAVGSAAGVARGAAPDETIDAGTDATAAGQALNGGCDDISKCSWETDANFKAQDWSDYGNPRIIGDVLYNCSVHGMAETAIDVSDTRGEGTSVSESVSAEVSVGILGVAKESVGFTASSGQSQSFKTGVKISQAVPVKPGFKGWTDASMLTGVLPGSVYITNGIHLVAVTGIDLTFPGWQGPSVKGLPPVVYSGTATPMTETEIQTHCNVVGAATPFVGTPAATTARAATMARAAQGGRGVRRHALPEKRYRLTVCRRKRAGSSQRRSPRCTKRTVKGVRPPDRRRVTATLERAGRVYARETDRRGIIRLTQRRTITPGRYRLILQKKPRKIIVRRNGKRLHRAEQHMLQVVRVKIGWTRHK